MNKTISLAFKKSTKGTHVYENSDYNLSLYVPKLLLDDPTKVPQTIEITIKG